MLGRGLAVGFLMFTALNGAACEEAVCCIKLDGDRLSVDLQAMPLNDALRVIGIQANATVQIRGDLGEVRPQHFRDLPFADGVRRLVGDHALLMIGTKAGIPTRILVQATTGDEQSGTQILLQAPAEPDRYGDIAHLDPRSRGLVLIGLGRVDGEQALPLLGDALVADPDPDVRQRIVAELAAFETDEAWNLIDIGLQDEDPKVRIEALRAQASRSKGSPYSPLAEALLDDPDPNVRIAAAYVLGPYRRAEVPDARGALERAMARAADRHVHEVAGAALGVR